MHGMMCHQSRGPRMSLPSADRAPVPAPRPPDDPVAEGDRDDALRLLRRGFADGVVQVNDLEDGLAAVYAARTVGDINAATSLLPRAYVANLERDQRERDRGAAARARRRAEVRSYLRVMSLLLTIWLVIGLTAGAWYPWPVWPALGWGLPLLASGRPARRDYDRSHGAFRTDPG